MSTYAVVGPLPGTGTLPHPASPGVAPPPHVMGPVYTQPAHVMGPAMAPSAPTMGAGFSQHQHAMGPGFSQPQQTMGPAFSHPQHAMGPAFSHPQHAMGPGMSQPQHTMGPGMSQPQHAMGPGMSQPVHPGMRGAPGRRVSDVTTPDACDHFTWELSDASKWSKRALDGSLKPMYSSYFYMIGSDVASYKMRLSLERKGETQLKLLIEAGPNDDYLMWPCPYSFIIEILDLHDPSRIESMRRIIRADQFSKFRKKPAAGKPHFACVENLQPRTLFARDSRYIANDTMYIKVSRYDLH